MIRITEITELDEFIRVIGVLDGENLLGTGKWIMPSSPLVPEKTWGSLLANPRFEYRIDKIKID